MSFKKHIKRFVSEARTFRVAPGFSNSVICDFLESLDCPRALTVAILFRNEEHGQLADLSFDPLHYLTSNALGDAYAATKFLSKYKDLSLSYDLDEVALLKFDRFESQCRLTNNRFRDLQSDPLFKGPIVWLHHAVKRKIASLLGDFRCQDFTNLANWGPGATTRLKARDASSAKKFQCETGITRDLYHFVSNAQIFEVFYPRWLEQIQKEGYPSFEIGNKVVTVPKDATANRVIAIEPGINLWFQKAIGSMLQSRLNRVGIDLRDQSRNQFLARKASIDALSATVDFSSASDSISRLLVEDLFSYSDPLWYQVMDVCRSQYGCLDKGPKLWEKFSSMGNGFTFQLESLIFYAAAICCVEYLRLPNTSGDVSVYGDDVIVPIGALDLFRDLVKFYGFTFNEKKSFFSSPFRESCGSHYVSGSDVKPVYLKGKLTDVRSIYRLANAFRRYAHRRGSALSCCARFRNLFYHLVFSVPARLRCWIPETLGDGGFIGNFDEARPSRAQFGVEGYLIWHLTEVGYAYWSDMFGLLLDRTWALSVRACKDMLKSQARLNYDTTLDPPSRADTGNSISVRGKVILNRTRSLVSRWYDLGPWI